MGSRQFVIFEVNNEEFGIDIACVNIIEKPMEIFKIPNTPEYVEGLINLRGKVHTVFNLRKRFNLPPVEFDENTKIIIVNVDSAILGLIVDSVHEIIRVEDADIEPTPQALADLKSKFIDGIAKVDSRVILLLNLQNVLSMEV